MMFATSGPNSLDSLITLIEYVKDPKKRVKELTELRDARNKLVDEQQALAKAHGSAKKLAEADKTLSEAQRYASGVIADATNKADKIVKTAETKAGDLKGEKDRLTRVTEQLNGERVSFNKTSEGLLKDIERRERRCDKLERDLAQGRTDLGKERDAMRNKAQRVAEAMKG